MPTRTKTAKFGPFEGELEKAQCPSCGADSPAGLVYRCPEGIGYNRCRGCGILFASPRFTEDSMLRIYETQAFADLEPYKNWSYEEWRKRGDRTYVTTVQKVELIKSFLPAGSRILDVGCAMGLLVLEANRQGMQAEGIEPSAMLSGIARDILKVPVASVQVEEFHPTHLYDGIVIWDVIEHLYDPVRVLKKCCDLLVPGGIIFLQVPHTGGVSFRFKNLLYRLRLKKAGFKHFGFPWHVYAFDRRSLTVMLEKTGFRPLRYEAWSHLLKEGKRGFISRIAIGLVKRLCLSDYIVCVARKR